MSRRRAVLADAPAIARLLRDYHAALDPPFRFDEDYARRSVLAVMSSPGGFVRVVDQGGRAVGFILAMVSPMVLAPVMALTELAWWVDPAHRGSRHSTGLVEDMESWARSAKVELVGLAALDDMTGDRLGRWLAHRGYRRCESNFLKVL